MDPLEAITKVRELQPISEKMAGRMQFLADRDTNGQLRCVYCGHRDPDGTTLTLDHVVPRSIGGSNRVHNLVLCCARCNQSKGDLELHTWAPDRSFLVKAVRDALLVRYQAPSKKGPDYSRPRGRLQQRLVVDIAWCCTCAKAVDRRRAHPSHHLIIEADQAEHEHGGVL